MNRQQSGAVRIVGCAVVMILCFILESGTSLKISFFGAHFDFLPPIIASTAVCLGCPAGIVCGLLAGMLYDTAGWSVDGILPIYYMVWGIVGGFAGEKYSYRPVHSVFLLSIGMTVMLSVIRYLFYFQFTTEISLLTFIASVALQAVLTAILCPFVFGIIRGIAGQKPKRLKKLPRSKKRRNSHG